MTTDEGLSDRLSPIYLYGDIPFFQKLLKEGYTKFAYISGPWHNDVRIPGCFVLAHENGEKFAFTSLFLD